MHRKNIPSFNKLTKRYCSNLPLTLSSSVCFSSQRLFWIENNPIFCKESGRLDVDKKAYLAGCFFFCCRNCNVEYHKCVLKVPKEYCLKAAYNCAGVCLKESSLKITIKGW